MLVCLLVALAVAAEPQSSVPDRARAEQLAQAGHAAEAIKLFEQIGAENPSDIEARLWIARLALRMGRPRDAETEFRSIVDERPSDVDARIGLASALIQIGQWPQALALLQETEREAGENSDFFGALGRAYRRAGDNRRALEYFGRAKTLAPNDPDAVSGFESTAQAYGHALVVEGFNEHLSTGADTGSGELRLRVRAMPRLHVEGSARVQQRDDVSDAIGGASVLWRAGRATNVGVRALGGSGNTMLPTTDVSGDVVHYAGSFEAGGSIRRLSFPSDEIVAASPLMAWDSGRWRSDARYTYSRSSFGATGETAGDHSVLLRETWRGWRRADLSVAYAYGIESFEDLTADRLGALDATTVATAVRFTMPSLTLITTDWEHQWRSNSTAVDRLTVSIGQFFP